MSEPKLNPTDALRLQLEAERLIAEGRMPSLAEFLSAIEKAKQKFGPLIKAERKRQNGA